MCIRDSGFGGQIAQSPRVDNFPGIPSVSGAELSDKMLSHAPVSYTHLDVYKRQFTLETEVRRVFLAGIQKLTLLDYPGKVACTVFTAGCDLRCPFCHNASLALPERESDSMELDDLLAFLRKRQGILDGVAVTGGEPLMHPGIADVLGEIKALGYSVKLDTNGTFPKRLREIVEAKLADRVAMDIKAAPENYGKLVGIPGYDLSLIHI